MGVGSRRAFVILLACPLINSPVNFNGDISPKLNDSDARKSRRTLCPCKKYPFSAYFRWSSTKVEEGIESSSEIIKYSPDAEAIALFLIWAALKPISSCQI